MTTKHRWIEAMLRLLLLSIAVVCLSVSLSDRAQAYGFYLVFFDYGSTDMSKPNQLDSVDTFIRTHAQAMNDRHQRCKVLLESNSDWEEGKVLPDISRRRADAVYNYMLDHGLGGAAIEVRDYQAIRPYALVLGPEPLNRRVDIRTLCE